MIEVSRISKHYKERKILDDVSFIISKGDCVSLLGINGAGKTTLSHILAGIKQPSSGDVLYNNQSIYKDISAYKEQVSICQQTPNLDSNLTLHDNLFFSGKFFNCPDQEIYARIEYVTTLLSLKEYLNFYDYQLSGGFKQRFMIARSLIHNPKFIILDEPTVAMDANIRRELWDIIKELKSKEVSVLLTTHYLEEAEFLSDRVCILHKGKIKINDSIPNILAHFQKETLEEAFLSFINSHENNFYKEVR